MFEIVVCPRSALWGMGVMSAIYPNDANGQLIFLETSFNFQNLFGPASAANIIALLTQGGPGVIVVTLK